MWLYADPCKGIAILSRIGKHYEFLNSDLTTNSKNRCNLRKYDVNYSI